MRKKIELIIFWVLVLLVAILVFLNINFVKGKVEAFVLLFGYPGVLIAAALADALEQPIGPEVPAVISILFGLNPLIVLGLTFLGSAVGSLTSFYVGKRFLTHRIANLCSTKSHVNLCKLFQKYGRFELAIAAISPVPFVSSCWLAGSFNIHLKDFIIFAIFPRMIRLSFVVLIFFIGFAP